MKARVAMSANSIMRVSPFYLFFSCFNEEKKSRPGFTPENKPDRGKWQTLLYVRYLVAGRSSYLIYILNFVVKECGPLLFFFDFGYLFYSFFHSLKSTKSTDPINTTSAAFSFPYILSFSKSLWILFVGKPIETTSRFTLFTNCFFTIKGLTWVTNK